MPKNSKPKSKTPKPPSTPKDAIVAKCKECICGPQRQINRCTSVDSNADLCDLWHLVKAKHTGQPSPMPPLKAIRTECLRCMGGKSKDVEECAKRDCALWVFRFGMLRATARKHGYIVDP